MCIYFPFLYMYVSKEDHRGSRLEEEGFNFYLTFGWFCLGVCTCLCNVYFDMEKLQRVETIRALSLIHIFIPTWK